MILKRKLSIRDILQILNSSKKVNRIVCSRGTYNHLPKRALKALHQMEIEIKVVNLKRGKKPKVDVGQIKRLVRLPAQEISTRMHVPLRTVYYHLKNIKRRAKMNGNRTNARL